MRRLLGAIAILALTTSAAAQTVTEVVRPIASFAITLMPPGKGQKPFGWIELRDAAGKASGFIYMEESDDDPHVGGNGTYVVTHLPYEQLGATVAILQSVRPLQIRFSGADAQPSVFIESAGAGASAAPSEVSKAAAARRSM